MGVLINSSLIIAGTLCAICGIHFLIKEVKKLELLQGNGRMTI